MRAHGDENEPWTAADVADQSGRIAVVTGAGGGLGLETAKVLAARGATVVLACRDSVKAVRARRRIQAGAARADVQIVRLDLVSLASVREAAEELRSAHSRLGLLINNAGVMTVPYQRTEDGFERTLATNHLGHFAFTGLLLDRLLAAAGSRIVTVSSLAHRRGVIRFDDLQSERGYKPAEAYDQSKLANLLFTYELQARLEAAAARTVALAAHPGNVPTALWQTSSRLERALISPRLRVLNFWLAQSPEQGALPTLRAAVDPSARGGEYYGPSGLFEFSGYPTRVQSSARSRDTVDRRRLWEISERLTGVTYRVPKASGPEGDDGGCD
ncbi:MAG TPA: oxidoreductase [Gaiellaceae bacterium]|nr:oxidoreductase [Gaiellaceae bacterium]HET8653311.1 oxidoreductase [Gaiellaceae bacterium]